MMVVIENYGTKIEVHSNAPDHAAVMEAMQNLGPGFEKKNGR